MTPDSLPRLWAITPPEGAIDPAIVDAWAPWHRAIGLWLRTPDASPATTWARTGAIANAAIAAGCPVVLGCAASDIAEAAAFVHAHRLAGLVLRGDPSRASLLATRALLPADAWLARSIHGPVGDHEHCTFSVLGPIFAPHTAKPWPVEPFGIDALPRVAAEPSARIVAVGGIDASTASPCIAAGAWGLAGIRSFFGPPARVAEDVAALGRLLPTATRGPQHP